MKTGRKTKPAAVKRAAGNPGKRKLRDDEPACGTTATCPNWLSAEAKSEWRRLAPVLRGWGLLTAAERALFALLCESYADVRQITLELAKGNLEGMERRHRESARDAAMKMVVRISSELGLSPSVRANMVAPKPENADTPDAFKASNPRLRIAKRG